MHPRSLLALGIGGLAAVVALAAGLVKQVGVKSYGHPVGRVVRADQHLAVLIETRDPYMPSLKGVPERNARYSYTLWLMPETGDGDTRTIRMSRSVPSGSRMHAIGARQAEHGVLWLAIDELQGIDLASGRPTTQPAPASIANTPISQLISPPGHPLEEYRARSVTLTSGDRLVLATDEEASADLATGARLYDNPTAKGTYKPRTLRLVSVQPGPIPRVATSTPVGDRSLRNGAFMREAKAGGGGGDGGDGSVVRFTNPDGFLIVHEAGDPVHPTVHLSRLNADGSIAWTADTRIGRLTQVLPHATLPAFVGELPAQLTEPMLSVVHLKDGTVHARSLKGPLN